MKPIKAVKIVWRDAEADNSWTNIQDLKDPGDCHTLGYLVRESETFYHISSTITEIEDAGKKSTHVTSTIAIPKAWVISMFEVKNPKSKK